MSKTDQLSVELAITGEAGDSSTSPLFAPVQLRLGDHVLGTLDDASYLPAFKAALIRMVQAPPAGARELACLSSDRWQIGMFGDDVDGRYLVSLGETFDDFLILACRVDSCLVILWALLEHAAFEYPGMVPGVPHKSEVLLIDAEAAIQVFLRAAP